MKWLKMLLQKINLKIKNKKISMTYLNPKKE